MAEPEVITPSVLFVYGTLRSGFHNNHYLKDATLLGLGKAPGRLSVNIENNLPFLHKEYYKRPSYDMAAELVTASEETFGEIYEVPKDLWPALDRLECHPRWYRRELADVAVLTQKRTKSRKKIKAWVYYSAPGYNYENERVQYVPSCDFADAVTLAEETRKKAYQSYAETRNRRLGFK